MARFASSTTTDCALKRAWTKRPNDCNNNGQAMHGARKPPRPTIAHYSKVIFKFSLHPNSYAKIWGKQIFMKVCNNNGQAMHGARKPPGPKVVHHVDMHGVDCGHYKLVA